MSSKEQPPPKLAVWATLAAIVTFFAGIAAITGYSLRDFGVAQKEPQPDQSADRDLFEPKTRSSSADVGQAETKTATQPQAVSSSYHTPPASTQTSVPTASVEQPLTEQQEADVRELPPIDSSSGKIRFSIEPGSVVAGYSGLAPDLYRIAASLTIEVTNNSDRPLNFSWFKPEYNMSLTLGSNIELKGTRGGVSGIPYCRGTGPANCWRDEIVSVAPGESVVSPVKLEGQIPAADYRRLASTLSGAFSGKLAVQPGGIQQPYLKAITGRLKIANAIDH